MEPDTIEKSDSLRILGSLGARDNRKVGLVTHPRHRTKKESEVKIRLLSLSRAFSSNGSELYASLPRFNPKELKNEFLAILMSNVKFEVGGISESNAILQAFFWKNWQQCFLGETLEKFLQ